jgi:hypothetical protein
MGEIDIRFNSWTEFVDAAEKMEGSLGIEERMSRRMGNASFSGTDSFEECIRLARCGWPEGAKRVKAKLDLLHAAIPAKRVVKEVQMSRVGPGIIDMGRYKQGHPAPWVTWQDTEVESNESPNGQIITIAFNITASGGVSTDVMFRKGATIAALADILERSGKRVELILIDTSQGNHDRMVIRSCIKRAEDPLDIDRVTFAVANASTLRRLGFSIYENQKNAKRNSWWSGGTYGSCVNVVVPGAINVHSTDLRYFSDDASQIAWLKQNLAEQGVEWDDENEKAMAN